MVGVVGVGLGRAAGIGIERGGLCLGGRSEGLPCGGGGGGPACSQRFFSTLRPPDVTPGLERSKGCRGERRTLVGRGEHRRTHKNTQEHTRTNKNTQEHTRTRGEKDSYKHTKHT